MAVLVLIFVFLAILWAPCRVFAGVLTLLTLAYFCPLVVVSGIIGAVLIKRYFGNEV